MKKPIAFSLILVLLLSLLAGCAGTAVVYYGECTCPCAPGSNGPSKPEVTPAEGAVKTGLAVVTSVSDSTSATAEEPGYAQLDADIAVNAACCAGVTPATHQAALDTMRCCQIDVI